MTGPKFRFRPFGKFFRVLIVVSVVCLVVVYEGLRCATKPRGTVVLVHDRIVAVGLKFFL